MRILVLLAAIALSAGAFACDHGKSNRATDASDILKADSVVADAAQTPAPAPKKPAQ